MRDVRELFEVMGALEALAGELACRRIGDGEVAEIKALTFEMLACHARSDLPAYYRINRAIHDRIAIAAANEMLRRTYESLNARIQNLRFRSNFDRATMGSRRARARADGGSCSSARDGARPRGARCAATSRASATRCSRRSHGEGARA